MSSSVLESAAGPAITPEEASAELLQCARYGEAPELQDMLAKGADVNHCDQGGNTALHMAAANGHLDCVTALVAAKAKYLPNTAGNTPLHWAAQNQHAPVVRCLLDSYKGEITVLAQNKFGQGALSDAFASSNAEVVSMLLEHDSAAELEETYGKGKGGTAPGTASGAAGKDGKSAGADIAAADLPEHAKVVQEHTHRLRFGEEYSDVMIRELALAWDGKAFDSEGCDATRDVTGINLWSAAVVLGRWIAEESAGGKGGLFADRVVCELGAGCGLPGVVASVCGGAKRVVLTDYFAHTVANLKHNIGINSAGIAARGSKVEAQKLDWADKTSWSGEGDGEGAAVGGQSAGGLLGGVDILVGSDLVYQESAVSDLVAVVDGLLRPGSESCFMYVTMDTDRDGMSSFAAAMEGAGFACEEGFGPRMAPAKFKANPLASGDQDASELHFSELVSNEFCMFRFKRKNAQQTPGIAAAQLNMPLQEEPLD